MLRTWERAFARHHRLALTAAGLAANRGAAGIALIAARTDAHRSLPSQEIGFIPPWAGADALRVRRVVGDGLGGLTRGLHQISKPVIAAVNGWALAGELELALACDIRIASERAQFGSFEVRRGHHHGDEGIVRLVNT